MNGIERRKYKRYPVYCPIEYRREDDNPIDSCVTLNLSEGGALISTKKLVPQEEKIIIKIQLKRETFFVRARVVHVEPEEGTGVYNMGVEFMQNSFNFIRRYYEEIETIMLYQREYARQTGQQISLPEASMKWYNEPH